MISPKEFFRWVAGIVICTASLSAVAGTNEWTSNGPAETRIEHVFVSPHNDQIVFAIRFRFGLFKSTDAAQTWTRVYDRTTHDVVFHPLIAGRVYAATDEGFLRSDDGGLSYNIVNTDFLEISKIALSSDGETIYIGTLSAGIHKSDDGGVNWEQLSSGLPQTQAPAYDRVAQLKIDPFDGSIFYAVIAVQTDWYNVYRSDDGGQSWQLKTPDGLLPTNESTRARQSFESDLIPLPEREGALVWATTRGIQMTTDRGENWLNQSFHPILGEVRSLAIDPADPEKIYVVDSREVLRSTDAGDSWTQLGQLPGGVLNNHDLAIRGNGPAIGVLAASTGVGIIDLATLDTGFGNTGLNASTIRDFHRDPGNPDRYYAVNPGSGLHRTDDRAQSWTALFDPLTSFDLGTAVAINPQDPDHLLYSEVDRVQVSFDAGETWEWVLDTFIGVPGPVQTNEIVFDSLNPNNIYLAGGTDKVWKSGNSGIDWIKLESLPAASYLSVLVDPGNSSIVYAASWIDGVYKSVDGGQSWVAINTGLGDVSELLIRHLYFDPNDANHLFAPTLIGLFHSTDGGANWSQYGNLPPQPYEFMRSLAFDPELDNALLVGTSHGVIRTFDAGENWEIIDNGVDTEFWVVLDIEIQPGDPDQVHISTLQHAVRSIEFEADIDVAVQGPANPVAVGQSAVYDLTISSNGPYAAANVTVELSLPQNTSLVWAMSDDAQCSEIGGLLTCVIDVLRPTAVIEIDLILTVNSPGKLEFTVTVAGRGLNDNDPDLVTPVSTETDPPIAIDKIDHDADGDGKSDIFWRHVANGRNYLWMMDGLSTIDEGEFNTVGDPDWQIVGIGDFDDDDKADMLWRHAATGRNYIYLIDGKTIKQAQEIVKVTDSDWRVVGVGDLDGDGKADIVWRHATTGRDYVYLMDGFTVKSSQEIRTVSDLNWKIVGVDDFDGDGKDDLIWRHSANGRNYVYLMDGFVIASEGEISTVTDLSWKIVGTGDRDADGKADVYWRNKQNGRVHHYLMDGTSIKQSVTNLALFALHWELAGTGDYDGDGRADHLWRSAGSIGRNHIWMYQNSGDISPVGDPAWRVMP